MDAIEDKIYDLEEWFTFHGSPEDIEDSQYADMAICLLDKIKELTGIEYAFAHIQMGANQGVCAPEPKDYSPRGSINVLLGRYDRQFFVDLKERLQQRCA